MSVCVPIKKLKNTAEFARIVREADGPVVVTRNGYDEFVSMTPERYEALRLEAARARLYQVIDRAEDDVRAGRTTDARTSIAETRKRYGL